MFIPDGVESVQKSPAMRMIKAINGKNRVTMTTEG